MDKQGPELLKVEELAERVRELEMHLESLQNRYAQVTGENEALRIPEELLARLRAFQTLDVQPYELNDDNPNLREQAIRLIRDFAALQGDQP